MQDLRGTLLNITKNVTKTSGDFMKTTKLSLNLSTEETNLKNIYTEIGRKVHEIYLYGGSLGKFFDEQYREIEACERKIAELKEQIGQIKGTRECPKCGKSLDRTAEFCPKCGFKQDVATTVEAAPPPAAHAAQMQEFHQPAASQPAAEYHTSPPIPPETYHTPEPPPIPSPIPEPVAIAKKICRICNGENEISSKFCLSCGRILD